MARQRTVHGIGRSPSTPVGLQSSSLAGSFGGKVGVAVRGETSMHHRPHWSYSAISQYLSCPLRFFFQRVQRLPQMSVGSSLVLGSSVHAALAEYHRTVQQDEPTDTAKLHQIIADTWT